MGKLDTFLDELVVDPVDPGECCSKADYEDRIDEERLAAVDEFVDELPLDDAVELMVENAHLKHMYLDPELDVTSFDTIVRTAARNLIYKSHKARNA